MYLSSWYYSLNQPPLNPPYYIFPPVWIVLYATLLIGLIVYTAKPSVQSKLKGYIFFVAQLFFNLLWSPAFFVLKNITLALIIIVLLDVFVILTLINFYKISKTSCFILVPYFLWILFATYLNAGFFVLNVI